MRNPLSIRIPALVVVGLGISLAACGDDDEPAKNTIVDAARANGSFTTLVAALEATGLDETLAGRGPFTVFAPTDAAFARLPAGVVESLDAPTLARILEFHVVSGRIDAARAGALSSAESVEGSPLALSTIGETLVVDGFAQVVTADLVTDNGVIHVIDAVLLPPDVPFPGDLVEAVSAYPILDTLEAAVAAADLATALSSAEATIFAPTNAAFAALPAGTLASLLEPANQGQLAELVSYHAAPAILAASDVLGRVTQPTLLGPRLKFSSRDGVAYVNDAGIRRTDLVTENGRIHVIDAVLSPPGDLVSVAQAAGNFDTLLGVVEAAGLTSTLAGPGPFTVFAPTDAAFAAFAALASSPQLADVLTYHVVSGELDSQAVVALAGSDDPRIATLSGIAANTVRVGVRGGSVVLDGVVRVVATDIVTRNGILHVIDAVLLPAGISFPGTVVEALAAYPTFATLVSAVGSAGLAGDLSDANGGEGFTVFAPDATAFEALGIDLGTLTTAELTDVLLYHVVGGTVDAATVVGLTSAPTLQSSSIGIAVEGGTVRLDDRATVIRTDLRAENGIVHVLDAVLLPPAP